MAAYTGNTLNTLASSPHYAAHLAPITALLPDELDVTVVASYRDLLTARKHGRERIVLAQHGAGQSYGGDPTSAHHPSYAGGDDNHDVGLFLAPNAHAADRWRDRYPRAAVRVVGCPRLDTIPGKSIDVIDSHPVVAVSFHSDLTISPEARSTFGWYRSALPLLAERFKLIGHGHPKRFDLPKFYQRNGIEFVRDFDEVSRRADIYVCDNSSTLFEFAHTGRPVVVLNAPWYRLEIRHGLRFWEDAEVGMPVHHPNDLLPVVTAALGDGWHMRREAAVDHVYAYRRGAAQRAAGAIMEWAA